MENKILEILSKNQMKDAYILAYFTDQVLVGLYENQSLLFAKDRHIDYDLLTKMHVFNQEKEVRMIIKNQEVLNVVLDSKKDEDVIDEDMYIIGEDQKAKDIDEHFVRVTQYGRVIDLPKKAGIQNYKEAKLLVRNHFMSDSHGFTMDHYRLVDIREGVE